MFLIQIRKPVSHWSYFREKGGGPLWGWGRSRRTQGRGMDSLQKETTGRTPGGICSPSPGCTSFCASSSSFPLWALAISVSLSTQWTVPTQNKVPEYCTVIVISSHPSSLSGWSSALALKSWERDSTGLTQVRSPLGSGHPQPAGSLQVAPADSLPAPVCLPLPWEDCIKVLPWLWLLLECGPWGAPAEQWRKGEDEAGTPSLQGQLGWAMYLHGSHSFTQGDPLSRMLRFQ